ncbi:MAG: hypothetical protein ACPGMR_08605 [Pontibacterium sp.]
MREQDRDFFQPLWRRVAILLVCFCWAAFEWLTNEPFWGVLATGFTGYAYWAYFHTFEPEPTEDS